MMLLFLFGVAGMVRGNAWIVLMAWCGTEGRGIMPTGAEEPQRKTRSAIVLACGLLPPLLHPPAPHPARPLPALASGGAFLHGPPVRGCGLLLGPVSGALRSAGTPLSPLPSPPSLRGEGGRECAVAKRSRRGRPAKFGVSAMRGPSACPLPPTLPPLRRWVHTGGGLRTTSQSQGQTPPATRPHRPVVSPPCPLQRACTRVGGWAFLTACSCGCPSSALVAVDGPRLTVARALVLWPYP